MDLHLDETHIQARHSFLNKSCYFGPADNDHNELSTAMQAYMMTTLTEKNAISLCSNPAWKMKTKHLTEKLIPSPKKLIIAVAKWFPSF